MDGYSMFRSHRQVQRHEWPWVLLGQIPNSDRWIALSSAGIQTYIVSSKRVEEMATCFVHAKRLPPGTREYVRPVEIPLEALGVFIGYQDTPQGLPLPLPPLFPTHKTLIEAMLVGERWKVYCGYDTLAREWLVAGEPEEVRHV